MIQPPSKHGSFVSSTVAHAQRTQTSMIQVFGIFSLNKSMCGGYVHFIKSTMIVNTPLFLLDETQRSTLLIHPLIYPVHDSTVRIHCGICPFCFLVVVKTRRVNFVSPSTTPVGLETFLPSSSLYTEQCSPRSLQTCRDVSGNIVCRPIEAGRLLRMIVGCGSVHPS